MGEYILGDLQYSFYIYFTSFMERFRNLNYSRLLDTSHNLDDGSTITDTSNTFTTTRALPLPFWVVLAESLKP